MTITLVHLKEKEFDRGTKKVLVNGEHWGWIRTKFHGMHGTSFHLSDLHGIIYKPAPTNYNAKRMVELECRSVNKRHLRIENIFKDDDAKVPIPTNDEIIIKMIANAIASDWFRSPTTRKDEIKKARKAQTDAALAEKKHAEKMWENVINDILVLGTVKGPDALVFSSTGALREAIHDAMKWAQTQ